MKIVSWNVNGIRAVLRKKALSPLIDDLQPDVVAVQETKAQPDQIDLEVEGFANYWHSAAKKGYSGTGFMVKQKPLNIREGMPEDLAQKHGFEHDGYGHPNEEGRVIAAEYAHFWLVNVYTPNSKDDLTRLALRHDVWDPAFLEYLLMLRKDKPVVFCGDLNVAHTEQDLARPKQNIGKKGFTDEERAGVQQYIDNGFVDTFRMFHEGNGHYTWWTHWANARERNVGWRIDYIFVSEELKDNVRSADIHPGYMGSDHCPTSVVLEFK